VARNLRVFWRDRINVLFSILGPLILLFLSVAFFRNQTADRIKEALPGADSAAAFAVTDSWIIASVVVFATFTTGAGMLSAFVEDRASGRFSDYLVSPVRRGQLTVGYLISVLAFSFAVSAAIMAAGQGWAWAMDRPHMSLEQAGEALGMIALASTAFAAFNTLCVTFIKSIGGFNGYTLVLGVGVGFLAYCYVSPALLSESLRNVFGVLPFAQAGAVVRAPMVAGSVDRLLDSAPAGVGGPEAHAEVLETLAVDLTVNGSVLSTGFIVAMLAAIAVLLTALGAANMRRVIH
jgi:multidrug/hemolysin transport system permease protein